MLHFCFLCYFSCITFRVRLGLTLIQEDWPYLVKKLRWAEERGIFTQVLLANFSAEFQDSETFRVVGMFVRVGGVGCEV